jgi:hypothetical protein
MHCVALCGVVVVCQDVRAVLGWFVLCMEAGGIVSMWWSSVLSCCTMCQSSGAL